MPKEIQALQIRNHLGEVLNRVKYKNDLFLVKRGQEPMGVLIGFDDYQYLTMLVEKMSKALGPKLTKVLNIGSKQTIDEIIVQSKSLVELVNQNENFLTRAGLNVNDLLDDLSIQREKHNLEKYGIKTTA